MDFGDFLDSNSEISEISAKSSDIISLRENQIASTKDKVQARRFCFTWFNFPLYPTRLWAEVIGMLGGDYWVAGHEIAPTTGRRHIQGYIEFPSGRRLETLIRKTQSHGIHWEVCRGSQADNIRYCKKEGKWEESGEPKEQGKRNDLTEAQEIL